MKKVIAVLFILTLLLSIAPLREIGKLLGKAQTTEEVHSEDCPGGDDDGMCKIKKEVDPFTEYAPHEVIVAVRSFNHKVRVAIHQASALPDHFVSSIPTPPPDVC